jgi:hypothetical protein
MDALPSCPVPLNPIVIATGGERGLAPVRICLSLVRQPGSFDTKFGYSLHD